MLSGNYLIPNSFSPELHWVVVFSNNLKNVVFSVGRGKCCAGMGKTGSR